MVDPYDDIPDSPLNNEPETQILSFFQEEDDINSVNDAVCDNTPSTHSTFGHTLDHVESLTSGIAQADDATILELQLLQYFREGPAQWLDILLTLNRWC